MRVRVVSVRVRVCVREWRATARVLRSLLASQPSSKVPSPRLYQSCVVPKSPLMTSSGQPSPVRSTKRAAKVKTPT